TLQVTFAKTGKTIPWDDSSESILEFAEANGINLEYGCRSGNCGTCSARLLSGEVVYEEDIKAETGEGEILTCSAIPVTDIVLDA
nr:2Fe-2S iron-sulfur cluster binding domain-containing protein [Nitrospinaceae bacterium]NIR56120.1 2Fe-2S iron-sulfur cluster binding domain-containing protein [Nitrospinaceae bacterium]NIS86568.1 2Fe-2S iron-sulfur cluster binding domain-containing protein [Nitrospinaceae bacterium]NIT83402.1 2Fe-2S iron-sulfur cluster binding domain-containing protein [Nitrospinaceae bacterium]NIU45612.1 2Fe-2S iron-sulfur cluster binding domain-containing protein [Nitrospinaceae bacterium]